ncbi:MAG: hypothetical protein KF764_12860 [Labilithrix sp.]|nr:hypothetical protein [Labilithrix sp.]MBX3221568.1 hypothetical protein [Labilithrix sp.]
MGIGRLLARVAPMLLAGCALFTSLDGFSSGGSGDRTDDAGDAGGDGAVVADTGGDDGAADGGADTSSEPFCASQPPTSRCTSFDDENLAFPFDEVKVGPGVNSYTTSDVVSAPRAMIASVPASSDAQVGATCGLVTTFDAPATSISARFAFRQVSTPASATNGLEIANLLFLAPGVDYQVNLTLAPNGRLYLDEYSGTPGRYTNSLFGPLGAGWHTIKLTATLEGGSTGKAVLEVDGTTKEFVLGPVLDRGTSAVVYLGAAYLRGVHSGWSVALDDVVASASD